MNFIPHSRPTISQDEIDAATAVLKSEHLEEGEQVYLLEKKLAEYVGHKYGAAVNSGFAAIHLSLIALGIGKNDEVIIPSYTCSALLNPILLLNAKPILADIGKGSFNLSPETVQPLITQNTKAIIVPHTFGIPARIDEICEFGIPVIEDCAQAIGGKYKGQKLGSFGALSIFSFYATKVLTGGDGGLITTNNENLLQKIKDHRYYGHKKLHKKIAYNYHMTNLPASIVLAQLNKLDDFVTSRKRLASVYFDQLQPWLIVDAENINQAMHFRFIVRSKNPMNHKKSLAESGIGSGFGVLDAMHQILEHPDSDYPNSTQTLKWALSLPIYPSLKPEEQHKIISTLNSI